MTSTMTEASEMLKAAGITPPKDEPDLHTMPVEDIVFDPALLDRFPSLSGDGMNEASKYVFSLYKSLGKNKERNSLLHRRISTFITTTRRSRQTGGMVTEAVKTTKAQRDNAALLASQGVTDSDLAEALRLLAQKRAGEES
jgi:hypothetical protein